MPLERSRKCWPNTTARKQNNWPRPNSCTLCAGKRLQSQTKLTETIWTLAKLGRRCLVYCFYILILAFSMVNFVKLFNIFDKSSMFVAENTSQLINSITIVHITCLRFYFCVQWVCLFIYLLYCIKDNKEQSTVVTYIGLVNMKKINADISSSIVLVYFLHLWVYQNTVLKWRQNVTHILRRFQNLTMYQYFL